MTGCSPSQDEVLLVVVAKYLEFAMCNIICSASQLEKACRFPYEDILFLSCRGCPCVRFGQSIGKVGPSHHLGGQVLFPGVELPNGCGGDFDSNFCFCYLPKPFPPPPFPLAWHWVHRTARSGEHFQARSNSMKCNCPALRMAATGS